MRHYSTPIRMAEIKKTDHTKYWQNVEKSETSYITGGKVNGTATLENSLTVVFEVKHILA